ncbi:MAG: KamA family radical SAM protein [Candidatus Shapirobacteria bacterium]
MEIGTSDFEKKEEEPPSNLVFKINPYLRKLAGVSAAVKRQFFPSAEENEVCDFSSEDPLDEDKNILVKGLVQKYPRRVLLELTMSCAAYCRFCTRRRMVSDIKKGQLEKKDIENVVDYLKKHEDINEVIISGGDPLMAQDILVYALEKLSKLKQLTILRVHTRVPVSNPRLVGKKVLDAFARIKKQAFYLSIHCEHPDEITKEVTLAISKIRKTGAVLLSQTVFLKGVNDSVETLKNLFTRLVELGIRPYYIYRCDPVKGAEHFLVPFEREIQIMTDLKKEVSGLAYPMYVIDAPGGSGKVPVGLNFWKGEKRAFWDYEGKRIEVVGP